MCLIKRSDEKIAQTNLITLKMLSVEECNGNISYMGYYRTNFKYVFEKKYKLNRKLSKRHYVDIGYHSLAKNNKTSDIFVKSLLQRKIKGKKQFYKLHYNALVLCVIPKGSSYYIGESNDIVSDSLIILEDISDKVFKNYRLTTSVIKEGFKYIENTYGKQNY